MQYDDICVFTPYFSKGLKCSHKRMNLCKGWWSQQKFQVQTPFLSKWKPCCCVLCYWALLGDSLLTSNNLPWSLNKPWVLNEDNTKVLLQFFFHCLYLAWFIIFYKNKEGWCPHTFGTVSYAHFLSV
jgi:hypothetical protein